MWLLGLLGRCSILFKQLLCRVELGSFLQSLDGSVAFLVQLLEVVLGVANTVVEVAHKRVTDAVEPEGLNKVHNCVSIDIQYWPASHHASLNGTPILPTGHESEHHSNQNIREAGIKRPHDACASRELLLLVIARGSSVDLAGESVERPLERGSIFATLSQSAIELACN